MHGTGKFHLHACSQVLCKDIIKDDTQLTYKCDLSVLKADFPVAQLSCPTTPPSLYFLFRETGSHYALLAGLELAV